MYVLSALLQGATEMISVRRRHSSGSSLPLYVFKISHDCKRKSNSSLDHRRDMGARNAAANNLNDIICCIVEPL